MSLFNIYGKTSSGKNDMAPKAMCLFRDLQAKVKKEKAEG